MKLQLDTDLKVIKLESSSNLGEFIEKIQALLPDWKDYKLETNVTINWNSAPTIIYKDRWPLRPWYGTVPCVTSSDANTTLTNVGSGSILSSDSLSVGSTTSTAKLSTFNLEM